MSLTVEDHLEVERFSVVRFRQVLHGDDETQLQHRNTCSETALHVNNDRTSLLGLVYTAVKVIE